MTMQASVFIGMMVLLWAQISIICSHSLSEISEELKNDVCKKLDPLKIQDQDFQFTIDGCQFIGRLNNSNLKGFSSCCVKSVENSSSSVTATILFPTIIWSGNDNITFKNCKFVNEPTTVSFRYNDVLSSLILKLTMKLQKQEEDKYEIGEITSQITLQEGVTRLQSFTPEDTKTNAIIAQAASLINEGDNYKNEQFNPFAQNLQKLFNEALKNIFAHNQ